MSFAPNRLVLRPALTAAAFIFCYAGVLAGLVDQWATNSTYSYGFAIPLISGYIIWSKGRKLQAAWGITDNTWGIPIVLVGLGMLWMGQVGALVSLQGTSLVVTLTGLILMLGGRDALKVIWFPIVYLCLMLPLWNHVVDSLQAPSQHLSATIATWLLRAAGVPALQQGTQIVLSSVSLEVMPECSGMNQLISLTVLVLPAAYLWLRTSNTRIALVVVAVVVGYLSNGVRIAGLGLLTGRGFNVNDPNSVLHLLPGFVTASVAYLTIWVFLSTFSKSTLTESLAAGTSIGTPERVRRRPQRPWLEAILLALMVSVGIAQLVLVQARVPPNGELASIPRQIGEWSMESTAQPRATSFPGFDVGLLQAYATPTGERRFAAADDELMRVYRSSSGDRVQLYVGYYRSQDNGKKLTGDTSRLLQKIASGLVVTDGREAIELKEVVERRDHTQRGVVFWYDINGRIVPNIYIAKGYSLWDTFSRRRSNAAVIMIAWESDAGEQGSERLSAISFAQALIPVLRVHLPS